MAQRERTYLIGGALAALALVWFCYSRIERRIEALEERHANAVITLERRFSELDEDVGALGERVAELQRRAIRETPSSSARRELRTARREQNGGLSPLSVSQANPASIAPGLYVLEQELTLRDKGGSTLRGLYTIYHIKTSISNGPKSWNLNVGLAVSGISALPIFYIDYDDDNKIDIRVMEEFAWHLPLGRFLARRIDKHNAQLVYNTFLSNREKASHTGTGDIQSSSGRMAMALWSFVQEQSAAIGKWLGEEDPNSGR